MYAKNSAIAEVVEEICQGYVATPENAGRSLQERSARYMSRILREARMINVDEKFASARAELKLSRRLEEVLKQRDLHALFQPILKMDNGEIIGYEGLIRGPSDSPLHSPMTLFKVARANNLTVEVEHLCRRVVIDRFAALALPGKLFLNVSPECMCQSGAKHGETLGYLKVSGIDPKRVIIELTENQPTYDYTLMRDAVRHYRDMGFQIAIDDLGEGFSSLRLWSELRPDFVKIDRHFIQAINQDPVKLQFVRSIQEIAEKTGTMVVAEGIETQSELLLVKDLGIKFGQGYHIARPNSHPATMVSAEVASALGRSDAVIYPHEKGVCASNRKVSCLLKEVSVVSPDMSNIQIHERFVKDPALNAVPVVDNGVPVGLITRSDMIDRFARLFQRELYGTKPCVKFMDGAPLIVDREISLQDLSQIVVDADSRHLANGFIITDKGSYLGMGTGHDLMREITKMQINAARYANPLTLLPGSVPINEHMDRMLANRVQFVLCYFDIDHFKPFNDVYGYRKGDAIIDLTGRILASKADPDRDMVGHIGGDDFIVVFQSGDWEMRCNEILAVFSQEILGHYNQNDVDLGGYVSEDRRGEKVFHALASLSIGAVRVDPGQFGTTYHIASVANEAKKQAKRMPGNSLFIDRRKSIEASSQ